MPAGLALALALLAVDSGRAAPQDGDAPASPPETSAATVPPAGPRPLMPRFAIRDVVTKEPVVALTFDACATLRQPNGFDRKVFNFLSAEKIPVTFYLSGRWVEKHPSAAKVIAAASFIELGNHSYSHPRLTLVRMDRLRMQIRRTNLIIEKQLGRRPLSLRPPAGAWNAQVIAAASREKLPVVTWTVVSGDVGGHVSPARMVSSVVERAKPGAIIIFHVNRREPYTKRALPAIVAGLREKGLRFVTVSQLLALPDAVPEPAKASRLGYGVRRRPRLLPSTRPAPTAPSSGEETRRAAPPA